MSYLKEFREENNYSIRELAGILDCSHQLINHIEKGRRRITAEKAVEWERITNGKLDRRKLVPWLFEELPESPLEECEFCGHRFDAEKLGRYGCPKCLADFE